jgi:hypothetical protein
VALNIEALFSKKRLTVKSQSLWRQQMAQTSSIVALQHSSSNHHIQVQHARVIIKGPLFHVQICKRALLQSGSS